MADNPIDYGWEKATWDAIKAFMKGNEYATAGWMGNLYSESWIIPFRKQGDFSAPDFTASKTYTNNIDTGIISKNTFMHDAVGYGLAQWTYYSRKEGMYNFWNTDEYKGAGVSIGSFNYNIAWFKKELLSPGYVRIYNHMLTVSDVDSAADYVLTEYEKPADIPATRPYRRAQARYYYQKYTGSEPGPGPGPGPGPDPPTPPLTKMKFKWIYYMRRKY